MFRLLTIALAVLGAVATVRASTYWVDYEASSGNFPEQEGWTRYTMYGGAQRWFEGGALVLDTRAYSLTCDWVQMNRPGEVDPGPGETFVMEWRLKVQEVNPRDQYDGDVGVSSDDAWRVGFNFRLNSVESVFENRVVATFSPYVFHDFRLVSSDMRNYVLWVDGQRAEAGVFVHLIGPSEVGWGDGVQGVTSLTHWEWFRFGVLPSARPGDTNCDGTVDFQDINPFVLALTDGGTYQQTYPNCWPENADINQDGTVNFGDINPFVALLTS